METEIFSARLQDTVNIALKTNKCKFLGFLSSEEKVLAEKLLKRQNTDFNFFGGYQNAERTVLSVPTASIEDYPISSLTIKYRNTENLTHRDFIGSLLGLGIKREFIGDILIENGLAVVFLSEEITDYVFNQLKKVGKVGVTLSKGFLEPLPVKPNLSEFSVTVASLRLDCVVSALGSFSRGMACEKITNGYVSVNSVVCGKITKQVENGDIITIRGKGKFFIDSSSEKTRKNRIILKFKKYI